MLYIFLLLMLIPSIAFSGQKLNPFTGKQDYCTTIKEADGSPSDNFCGDMKVTNGTITDNGDGTFSLNTSGSGPASPWTRTGTDVYTTNSGDNVGIGVNPPTVKLDIAGSIKATGTVSIQGSGVNYFGTNVGINTTVPSGSLEVTKSGSIIPLKVSSAAGTNGDYLKVDSSGNVSIGSTSSLGKLDVVGSSASTDISTFDGNRSISMVNTNTTNNNAAGLVMRTADANGTITTGGKINAIFTSHSAGAVSGDLALSTNNAGTVSEKMRITSAGNLGIGTTVVDSKISVGAGLGSVYDNELLTFKEIGNNGSNGMGIAWRFANNTWTGGRISVNRQASAAGFHMDLSTYGGGALTERMRIDSTGNVGIGTITIPKPLTVFVGSNKNFLISAATAGNENVPAGDTNLGTMMQMSRPTDGATGVATWYVTNTQDMAFGARSNVRIRSNGIERFSLLEAGNVGIGSDTTPDAMLEVTKAAAATPAFMVSSTTATDGDYMTIFSGGNVGIGTTANFTGRFMVNDNTGSGWAAQIRDHSGTGAITKITNPGGYGLSVDIGSNGSSSTYGISVAKSGTTLSYQDGAGNFGIGADTSPDAGLEVVKVGSVKPMMVSSTVSGDGDYFTISSGGVTGIGNTVSSAYASEKLIVGSINSGQQNDGLSSFYTAPTVTSGSFANVDNLLESNPASSSSATSRNFYALSRVNSGAGGPITATNIAYQADSLNSSATQSITNMEGFRAGGVTSSGGGVTNYYGFRSTSTSTPTNAYGFYTSQTAGTNYYAFYGAGTAQSYFGGNVGIGSVTPNAPLVVAGGGSTVASVFSTTYANPVVGIGVQSSGPFIQGYSSKALSSVNDLQIQPVAGNVGIGSASPGKLLDVAGQARVKTAGFITEYDNGNTGTAQTVDWSNGNRQKSTLTGNVTYTFTAPTNTVTALGLKLIQDGTGSRTATWPATVKWPGGTAPTLTTTAAAVDYVSCFFDGTNYLCNSTADVK